MKKTGVSIKHKQIDKVQSTMLGVIIACSAVTIFCLMGSKALLSQAAYQRKVANARNAAVKQIQGDVTAGQSLVDKYKNVFEGSNPTNIIGGKNDSSQNAVPPNGDNARIVLDALPSTYDFPALITSLSNILTTDGISGPSIGASDEAATADNKSSANPQPVPIQVTITGNAGYGTIQKLVKDLEHSIRPFDVTSLQLSGTQNQMSFNMSVTTYYQPAKSLDIGSKEVH